MIRGDIYLHPSLTEAFGTVIVEAASCGLYVVATAVGGVPEVLPPHMTIFAKPEEDGIPPCLPTNVRLDPCDDPGYFNTSSKSSQSKTLSPGN
jgi:glycosyltransferase involved in cell wall biosynthesis